MTEVLIIGAGASGIAAARMLKKRGVSFKILEARPRIGGRALTVGNDFPLELGAEFIHGTASRLHDLLSELRQYSAEIPDLHHQRRGKKLITANFWPAIEETLQKLEVPKVDISFAQALENVKNLAPSKAAITRSFIQGFDAARVGEVSAQAMVETKTQVSDPKERRVGRTLRGYHTFFEALSAPFHENIHFSAVVTKVTWKPDAVTASYLDGLSSIPREIRAKKLIVTLSVGVLKAKQGSAGSCEFSPEIPSKLKALERLEMGPVVKIMLEFKRDFWATHLKTAVSMLHTPKGNFQTWWTPLPLSWPFITAWSGGDPADRLSKFSVEEQTKIALRELSKLLSLSASTLKANFVKAHTHPWQADPFARGAYSYVKVGGSRARSLLSRPVAQTLFFAGEATSEEQNGTIEGAIETGERAAKQVIRALR